MTEQGMGIGQWACRQKTGQAGLEKSGDKHGVQCALYTGRIKTRGWKSKASTSWDGAAFCPHHLPLLLPLLLLLRHFTKHPAPAGR